MWVISRYEASWAKRRHERDYWFRPLEKLAERYRISPQFAGRGLRALVETGLLAVSYGQRFLQPPNDEFGTANRYYHQKLDHALRREELLWPLQDEYPAEFAAAQRMAAALTNGRTVKNVGGLCRLLARYGEPAVAAAIGQIERYRRRNLRRRLGYVEGILRERSSGFAADEEKSPGEP